MRSSRVAHFVERSGKEQIVLAEGYLPTDKIVKVDRFLRYYGFLSQSMEDYYQGDFPGKLIKSSGRIYGFLLTNFMWFIFGRHVLLSFIDDPFYREFLGETEPMRPAKQLTMAMTLWSTYAVIICRLYYRGERLKFLSWVAPFLIFKGYISPGAMGLDVDMTDTWFERTKKRFNKCLMIMHGKFGVATLVYLWSLYARAGVIDGSINFFWTAVLILWFYYMAATTYITFGYYDSLCYYFRIRFEKVNNDIESTIAPDNRMKPEERNEILRHVLLEHDNLCVQLANYNIFWSKYIMYSYFMFVAIMCYTTFQAFFTYNQLIIRAAMFALALESGWLFTKVATGAALVSNEAHASYGRLIRVTFEKYPIDLQIQIRMFIQRVSGPTIGFYCLDLFEITYSTYASIIAALGQNFLLIVDFVRSYAELGEERAAAAAAAVIAAMANATTTTSAPVDLAYHTSNASFPMALTMQME